MRRYFAIHLLQAGSGIRTTKGSLGHADVAMTMIYNRVLRMGVSAVPTPDLLPGAVGSQSGP